MTIDWQEQLRPGVALREIVQEATMALVAMDADRLEELARCCADLNRELRESGEMAEAAVALHDASGDLKLLGSILFETRANFIVLSRLHAIRIRETGHSARILGRLATRSAANDDPEGSKAGGDYGDN